MSRIRNTILAGALVAGTAGALVHNSAENAAEYLGRPDCEFPVGGIDGVTTASGAMSKVANAGGEVDADTTAEVYTKDGRKKSPKTDAADARGHIILQPGDKVDILHVEPQVCVAAGGAVVGEQVAVVPPNPEHVPSHPKS